ncbi:MAG: ACT domain-containing protein [bacterium]|nr:ACT domain-containing protein [bacterium]
MDENKLLLVDPKVLPEIYTNVIKAKKLLASGEAKNATEASKMSGISRSAFYKYKDYVFEYNTTGQIITLDIVLKDEAGILSYLLTTLYENGANILTIDQKTPSSGVATVSISFGGSALKSDTSRLIEKIRCVSGVVSVRQVHSR